MIELLKDRPLIHQLYGWMNLLGYCPDSRDFSKYVLGKSPNYLIACRAMDFTPSSEVFQSARQSLLALCSNEGNSDRKVLLSELIQAIDQVLLEGKPQ